MQQRAEPDSRGFAYLGAGDTRRALADFNQALATDPRIPTSLFGRSAAERLLGNSSAADRDAAAALAIWPGVETYLRKQAVLP